LFLRVEADGERIVVHGVAFCSLLVVGNQSSFIPLFPNKHPPGS
jgi:hypothetical protein